MRLRSLSFSVLLLAACSTQLLAQKEYSIAAVQGDKDFSPVVRENVRVTGIVTAILRRGFFIQTPDDKVDGNPNTSEGLYVFGEESVGSVSLGNLVQVEGIVAEYSPRNSSSPLSVTQITRPNVRVLSKDNPLPAPIRLTPAHLDPRGKVAQMEIFEGMRVSGDFTVVAPTSGFTNEKTGIATSNGAFFAVLDGTPRPFREPGLDVMTILMNRLPRTTPAFDMNPEMLRMNSTELGGKALDVPAGATLKGVTGVIDYFRRSYTLLIDPANPPKIDNIKGFVPVSPAADREVTVGSFNVQNFFDDEQNSGNVEKEAMVPKDVFQRRLTKVSLAIRNVLGMPDILGIVEVENLKVLRKIADKVNADAVAAGQADPKYVAYLEESNDNRGIDVAYLVRSTKIKVLETKLLGKDVRLDLPGSGDQFLHDRPPFLLRAEVIDTKAEKPLVLNVVVNHFKSYNGIDDEKDGSRVQNKRRLQAEWLAKWAEDRQKADPGENIILCGDFNAFQFNDGYNDLMGILKGKSDQNVLAPSKTAFATGLINLTDHIDARNRYSYTFDGSAQTLDHLMINKPLKDRLRKFGFARVDADFPLVWANDATRPERISDHDAPVVFLSLDPPPAKKS